eukprot:6009068-Amphidinium_carterae.1
MNIYQSVADMAVSECKGLHVYDLTILGTLIPTKSSEKICKANLWKEMLLHIDRMPLESETQYENDMFMDRAQRTKIH